MDFAFEKEWTTLLNTQFKGFDMANELEAVLFVFGVQVLGQGNRKYSKQDKINLMHVSVCTILEPYGYYKYIGQDKDGWPHFELIKELPKLSGNEQERLMKEALIAYFQRSAETS